MLIPILSFILIILLIITSKEKYISLYIAIMTFICVITVIDYRLKQIPDALDVYRGNTELKITGEYKDSIFIPTDTVVIFK